MTDNPAIGLSVPTCGYITNCHDVGEGETVMFLHGSGAGVSGWANWRDLIPGFSQSRRVIVPDLVGFGYTQTPADFAFRFLDSWVEQILAVLDALKVERTHIVGNSFGGSLALWLARAAPERTGRLVLMGPGGWPAPVGPELAALWDYKPSPEAMRNAMSVMAYNQELVTEELVQMRYRGTLREGAQEVFERVFPKPHQRWLDAQVLPIGDLQAIANEVLLIHGRDDRVVPASVSWNLHQHLPNSQLHTISKCGHWTMVEHARRFRQLVENFLDEETA
ncbi:MAG: alpha/beta fold hydrolase [Sphingomonadales bacterium]|nr:alpha/beta fold hydrolase [Sphingomonadales bacterium]